MAQVNQINPKQNRKQQSNKEQKIYGVYIQSLLTKKVILSINEVGKNLRQNLEKKLSKTMEGKCIKEGFIQPGSIKIMTYSSGNVCGDIIEYQTAFECMICHPVEGMLVECISKTITKAGIHAEVIDKNDNVPIVVFVARDHHFKDRMFSDIKENTKVIVRVIGVRFELNDPYICVIGKLIEKSTIRGGGEYSINFPYELREEKNDNNSDTDSDV
jgi:DNA-directed RNA polymerase subunit E'/Rpb7